MIGSTLSCKLDGALNRSFRDRISRRRFGQIALGSAASFVVPKIAGAQPKRLPNIIVITLDTLRWDRTSIDPAHDNDNTPFLARLSRSGIVFNKAYSTADNTLRSHFSLFTGVRHGFQGDYDIPENAFPYHLRKMGYETVAVTANPSLNPDTVSYLKCFDTYRFIANENRRVRLRPEMQEIFDYYNAPSNKVSAILLSVDGKYVVPRVREVLASRREKPLCLFVNFLDPHDPYYPPKEFYDVSQEKILYDFYSDVRTRHIPRWESMVPEEQIAEINEQVRRCGNRRWALSLDLGPEQLARYKARYDACIRYLDTQVAALFKTFKDFGIYEDSVVILTSDHGESFGEGGFIGHSLGMQGDTEVTTHVPFILIPEKKTLCESIYVDNPITIADVAPTIWEILGINSVSEESRRVLGDQHGKSLVHYGKEYFRSRNVGARFPLQTKTDRSQDKEERKAIEEQMRSLGYLE